MDITHDAVENLVTQFSSALDFYRELVQNSMDAGSGAVEVWLEFIEDTDGSADGTIAIHVDDFGEGMDEAIIDDQLTCLFSSTKENDLTKVGKFGIGFVSVFAIQPKAVLVHTGKAGEYWEVLFTEDRSFRKQRLQEPVEGTQVTLFLEGDRAAYKQLVSDSIRTLKHWCSHSDVDVTLEDRSSSDAAGIVHINEPFAVDGHCMVHAKVEGTEMVLAFSDLPMYGFYNKGLALAIERGETDLVSGRFSVVSFKIKSRYLEHTLSRETVMRDENYEKAMGQLRAAADRKLFAALLESMASAVQDPHWQLPEIRHYTRLAGYLARHDPELLRSAANEKILRTVDGKSVSLEQAWDSARRDGRLFMAAAPNELTDLLLDQGTCVLLSQASYGHGDHADTGDPVARLVGRFIAVRLQERFFERIRSTVESALATNIGTPLAERAPKMLVYPEQVLVRVEPEDDKTTEHYAFVSAAHRVLERAIEERRGRVRVASPAAGAASVDRHGVELGYGELVPGRVLSHLATVPLFVLGRTVARLMALPPAGTTVSDQTRRPCALVNVEHPHFLKLLAMWRHSPRVAAYCLAKSVLLVEDRLLERDYDLMRAALEDVLMPGEAA